MPRALIVHFSVSAGAWTGGLFTVLLFVVVLLVIFVGLCCCAGCCVEPVEPLPLTYEDASPLVLLVLVLELVCGAVSLSSSWRFSRVTILKF